jgi:hypothetical protein
MTDVKFTNPEWIKIRDFLLQDSNAYVGNEANCRRFVEALKGMSRGGAQWRLLPDDLLYYDLYASSSSLRRR